MTGKSQMNSNSKRSYRNYCGEYDSHRHEFSQILFGLQGSLEVDVEGKSAVVDTAYGLIIPAGAQHAYHCKVGARLLVIDTNLQESLKKIRPFKLPYHWQKTDNVVALLGMVAGVSKHVSQRRHVNPELLHQYVVHTLKEDWSVKRMAAFYCLSEAQFRRRWKEVTGKSPLTWLNSVRLREANTLLQCGAGLEDVASKIGYGSASALCVALHREFGSGARGARKAQ